jgi:NADPH2:quinone reductase
VNARVAMGHLKTRIAKRFALADIARAHEAVESGQTVGNVVVTLV